MSQLHSYLKTWNPTLKVLAPHPAVDSTEYVAGVGVPEKGPIDDGLLTLVISFACRFLAA